MRLTTFTDYSLRVLIYLAANVEEPATIAQIAQRYGISRNHLMKVAHGLGQKGYVVALRGKGGGLRLSRPPADINLGELVRSMETDLAIAECFGQKNQCIITPACSLRPVFGEALEAFLAVLDTYSLADVAPGKHGAQMVRLLSGN